MPDAAESKQVLRSFGPDDAVADPENVKRHDDGWRVQFDRGGLLSQLFRMNPEAVTLFDFNPGDIPRQGMVFRMKIKAEGRNNEFKLIVFLMTEGKESFYLIRSKPSKSPGDWVTLESAPASSDDMRGSTQLTLSLTATRYGTALVKDIEIVM